MRENLEEIDSFGLEDPLENWKSYMTYFSSVHPLFSHTPPLMSRGKSCYRNLCPGNFFSWTPINLAVEKVHLSFAVQKDCPSDTDKIRIGDFELLPCLLPAEKYKIPLKNLVPIADEEAPVRVSTEVRTK